jgi:cytochrome c oxidase subunit 1
VVAHFHYVMMGGTLIAFLGGLHYWWPKMFGRMYSELWAKIACLVIFLGFNLTFFPQFILGTRGMPRRYARYNLEFQGLHQMSTAGSMILGIGLVLAAGVLIYSLFRGRRAPANPWGAATLEWTCNSPPPAENFEVIPPATNPYDYDDLVWESAGQGYMRRQSDEAESPVEEPALV